MRPAEPPLKPHRRREPHGQEIRDLRPEHAKGRAGGVVVHMQVDGARAGLSERALPDHEPLHRREWRDGGPRIQVQAIAGLDLRQEGAPARTAVRVPRDARKIDAAADACVIVSAADRAFDIPRPRRITGVGRDRKSVDVAVARNAARAEPGKGVAEGDTGAERGIEAALEAPGDAAGLGIEIMAALSPEIRATGRPQVVSQLLAGTR